MCVCTCKSTVYQEWVLENDEQYTYTINNQEQCISKESFCEPMAWGFYCYKYIINDNSV